MGDACSSQKERWISSRDRVKDARIRLFCFPHAGSGATAYQAWKRELPSFVELCAIRLPGRETRLLESPCSDSSVLTEEIANILTEYCDIPYAIFGHSMGALLAFEVAQSLRAKGAPQPGYLFLSGRIAAHLPSPNKPLHDLPLDEFLAELEARYGALPRELLRDREILDFYLPILRADLKLIETYQYHVRPPLDCPILVSAGVADQSIRHEDLMAWRVHTTGDFEAKKFESGHFYFSGKTRPSILQLVEEKLCAIDATNRSCHDIRRKIDGKYSLRSVAFESNSADSRIYTGNLNDEDSSGVFDCSEPLVSSFYCSHCTFSPIVTHFCNPSF